MVVDTRHFTFCPDEKYLAIFSSRLRVISWETGKEVLKCPNDMVSVTTYSGYRYLSLQTQHHDILLLCLNREIYIVFPYPMMQNI